MHSRNLKGKKRIRTALLINNFIPLLFIVLVFTVSYYFYTSRLLMAREQESLMVLAEQLTGKLGLELTKMNNLALNVSYSSKLKQDIVEYSVLSGEPESPAGNLAEYRLTTSIVRTIDQITGPYKAVPQINIIFPDRMLIGAGIYDLLHPVHPSIELVLSQYNRQTGAIHYSGLQRDPLAEEIMGNSVKPLFISLFKTINDDYHNPLGVIEVKQYSETLFKGFDREYEKLVVFSGSGVQIYPATAPQGSIYSELAERENRNSIIDFKNSITGKREMIAVTECMESAWLVLTITDGSLYLKPVYIFLLVSTAISFIILATGFFISVILSRRITEPLRDLNRKIGRLDWNLLGRKENIESPVSSLGEVAELHLSFQEMNQKLDTSLSALVAEKTLQTQSRILALQAQMDPHFIYNMITNIGIMAEEGETSEIIGAIGSLSRILRYVADGSSFYVSLGEELKVVENYISCMRIRYGDDLDFSLDIPSDMFELKVPRHSILPLVENTVKYGLDTNPPWCVSITGKMDNTRWEILLEDTGTGFSDRAIKTLEDQIFQFRADRSKQLDFHINGMGLINLYSRFMIFYNDDFIFSADNRDEGNGVRITIGGMNEPSGDFFLSDSRR